MTFPFFKPKGPAPRIVDLQAPLDRIYAVGDIHGRIDHLEAMDQLIAAELAETPEIAAAVIYLGDYIDRGPHSAHVLDHLTAPAPYSASRICLIGNHDRMLLDVVDGRIAPQDWLDLGGASTLMSYSGESGGLSRLSRRALRQKVLDLVPERHIRFLRALPEAARSAQVLFSHAGGNPGKQLEAQTVADLTERRPEESEGGSAPKHGLISVHGHMRETIFLDKVFRICVDMTGARGDVLGALRLDCEKMSRRFLTVTDKEK